MYQASMFRRKAGLSIIPSNPGYYKWYATEESVLKLLKSDNLSKDYSSLLPLLTKKVFEGKTYYYIYVGIAVKESLRSRLNWHINQKHSLSAVKSGYLSTLRQSISSLICGSQLSGEKATSDFIDTLMVEWYVLDNVRDIHNAEENEMKEHCLIINIKDNKNAKSKEYRTDLKAVRKKAKENDMKSFT